MFLISTPHTLKCLLHLFAVLFRSGPRAGRKQPENHPPPPTVAHWALPRSNPTASYASKTDTSQMGPQINETTAAMAAFPQGKEINGAQDEKAEARKTCAERVAAHSAGARVLFTLWNRPSASKNCRTIPSDGMYTIPSTPPKRKVFRP
ncbi:hypothetical protein BDZ89DRAFT_1044169 [Hymenopellis radicata]|nr:hypothetical protein BDZ89DRAFT_1044169 [Hymenopellis radicata]